MSPQSHEQQPATDVPLQPERNELQAGEQSDEFVGEAGSTKAVEQASSPGPSPAAQIPVDQTGLSSTQAQPAVDQAAVSSQPSALPQGWMPQIADDTDLIEKEWVDKAKEIVAQTAHDPYLQNKEINKVRAEYLKKRYNKELKQSE